jgi:hypothetical protein
MAITCPPTVKLLGMVTPLDAERSKVPVKAKAWARFKLATTFPLVGEMVRVPSEFETLDTAPVLDPPMET